MPYLPRHNAAGTVKVETMQGRWYFERTEDERWRWLYSDRPGVRERESCRSFATYRECVLDAMRHAIDCRRADETQPIE